uniref:Saposin B-type domain-containing protein n=1 Tax=Globodera pallida TaxID=36090 RepID=A0A183C1G5_GLOPA
MINNQIDLMLLVLLIAFTQFFQIAAIIDCLSCASPTLHNQWQATGLPAIPPSDRFSFHTCDGTSSDYKPCGDVCMEMLVAVGWLSIQNI